MNYASYLEKKKRIAAGTKGSDPCTMKQAVFIYHDIIQYLMAVIISETEINTFGLMTVKMETLFGGV